MNELVALGMIAAFIALRLALPLLATLGITLVMERLNARWRSEYENEALRAPA